MRRFVMVLSVLALASCGSPTHEEVNLVTEPATTIEVVETTPDTTAMPTTIATTVPVSVTPAPTLPEVTIPPTLPPTTLAPVTAPPETITSETPPTGSCVIPQHICDRESGGDPNAVNYGGCSGRNCYGKYQWDPVTWDSVVQAMGRSDLVGNYLPDESTQDAVAAYVWAGGAGCAHWSACG